MNSEIYEYLVFLRNLDGIYHDAVYCGFFHSLHLKLRGKQIFGMYCTETQNRNIQIRIYSTNVIIWTEPNKTDHSTFQKVQNRSVYQETCPLLKNFASPIEMKLNRDRNSTEHLANT